MAKGCCRHVLLGFCLVLSLFLSLQDKRSGRAVGRARHTSGSEDGCFRSTSSTRRARTSGTRSDCGLWAFNTPGAQSGHTLEAHTRHTSVVDDPASECLRNTKRQVPVFSSKSEPRRVVSTNSARARGVRAPRVSPKCMFRERAPHMKWVLTVSAPIACPECMLGVCAPSAHHEGMLLLPPRPVLTDRACTPDRAAWEIFDDDNAEISVVRMFVGEKAAIPSKDFDTSGGQLFPSSIDGRQPALGQLARSPKLGHLGSGHHGHISGCLPIVL